MFAGNVDENCDYLITPRCLSLYSVMNIYFVMKGEGRMGLIESTQKRWFDINLSSFAN